jgi:hypothetical protein
LAHNLHPLLSLFLPDVTTSTSKYKKSIESLLLVIPTAGTILVFVLWHFATQLFFHIQVLFAFKPLTSKNGCFFSRGFSQRKGIDLGEQARLW